MKCFAARPDLGAEKEKRQTVKVISEQNTGGVTHSTEWPELPGLTHSPIAAMWNRYLDVCLHNGLVHRGNGVIIRTAEPTVGGLVTVHATAYSSRSIIRFSLSINVYYTHDSWFGSFSRRRGHRIVPWLLHEELSGVLPTCTGHILRLWTILWLGS